MPIVSFHHSKSGSPLWCLFVATFVVMLVGCVNRDPDWVPPRRDESQVVFQRFGDDCGVAALATVARLLGKAVGYDSLAKDLKIGPRGLSMQALSQLARDHGIKTIGYRFSSLRFADSFVGGYPWIALLGSGRNGHYVVVQRVVGDTVFVLDPAAGSRLLRRIALEKLWTGYALVITK